MTPGFDFTDRFGRLRSRHAVLLFCLLFSLSPVSQVWGQSSEAEPHFSLPTVDSRDLRFTRVSAAQGLSQTRVAQIAQTATPHGAWITPGLSLNIVVTPPWWQTFVFRVSLGLLLLVVLVAAYRARIESIRKRERDFRRLADNAPDLVMRFDTQLHLVYANPVVESYTGLAQSALLGKTVEEIAAAGARLPVNSGELPEVIGAARRSCKEFTCETPKGNLYFESRLIPELDNNGVPRSVLAITRDITEPKLAQEKLQLSEARLAKARSELAHVIRVTTMGQLTASVAHEVSQPLAGIVTNANACLRWLAGNPPDIEEARLATQRIIRDSGRAGDVVKRIRTLFSRKVDHFVAIADFNEAVNEVATLIKAEIEKHRIILHLGLSPDLPSTFGDRVQLQQVMLNLMLNGIEAMSGVQDRPRELSVRTEAIADKICIEVRDSGVGLDQESLKRMFDAFYTTKPNGMGMGLSISRSIIEAHDGKLWVIPNEGHGVTFWFSLPMLSTSARAAPAS
ncbi:MAG TPA: ATP-binding protein [Opitutaceae bacterium]|nr:ATP-binding protein [Opitutaceae bacterium]